MASEGMMVSLKAIPGLTIDGNGKKLLTQPFIFQCGPMDEFKYTRQYTFGNYDTIYDGQYTRQGSRQLRVWQFDTLAMILGSESLNPYAYTPSWVPFPAFDKGLKVQQSTTAGLATGTNPTTPEWYASQLANLFYSGCPFRFSAAMVTYRTGFNEDGASVTPVLQSYAVLLQYDEGYKQGEGDAIYFEGLSFSEWRDPRGTQFGTTNPKGSANLPTTVSLDPSKGGYAIPGGGTATTLSGLAKYFYGDPSQWNWIASANNISGGGANTPLSQLKGISWPSSSKVDSSRWPKLKIPPLLSSSAGMGTVTAVG